MAGMGAGSGVDEQIKTMVSNSIVGVSVIVIMKEREGF